MPLPNLVISHFGGEWPPPLSSYTVSLGATLGTNRRVPFHGGGDTPPHPISICSFTKCCHSWERGTPIPALMCPSQPCPSPPARRGWGTLQPPIAWGYPDPCGVGLVPGCPPALRVWGLSGRVFLGEGWAQPGLFKCHNMDNASYLFRGKSNGFPKNHGCLFTTVPATGAGQCLGGGCEGF